MSLSFTNDLPFCPKLFSGEEVPDGYSKFGLRQGKFDRWYYRVKKWKINGAGGGTISSIPEDEEGPVLTASFTGLVEEPHQPAPDEEAKEADMTCWGRAIIQFGRSDNKTAPDGSYARLSYRVNFGLFEAPVPAAYNTETELWHPSLDVYLVIYAENNGPSGFEYFGPVSESDAAEAEESGTLTVYIDGEEVPILWARTAYSDGDPIPPGNLTIAPQEYWEWNPGDGDGPTVDSSGEVIRMQS